MARPFREVVDQAIEEAFKAGDFALHDELLTQSVFLEVLERYRTCGGDARSFEQWMETEAGLR